VFSLAFSRASKKQLNLFWLALSFFSRLPVPKGLIFSPVHLSKSSRYFALVGWVLAIVLSLLYLFLQSWLPLSILLVLLLICSLLLTGAFHEDGLADCFDGLVGGQDKSHKLKIMKDSRLGTYGVSALFLALLLKWQLWLALAAQQQFIFALCLAYPLSRALAASFIFDMPYVGDGDGSKSKPVASVMSGGELGFLFISGGVSAIYLSLWQLVSLGLVLLVFRFWLKRLFDKSIGGITGDCLGAAQQGFELLIYLLLVIQLGELP